MKKIIMLISLLMLLTSALYAEDDTGIAISHEMTLMGTTIPEAIYEYATRFKIPFLRGDNPLTEGNNITAILKASVSPIHAMGFADAVWTPLALLEISAGGGIGSGWPTTLFGLFDNPLYGIGITSADPDDSTTIADAKAFGGAHLMARTGAALQFDLAAVYPGDWNHVVARTYHEINYKRYTKAKAGESWYFFEDDAGQYCNGPSYYGNMLAGYQMPIVINMVALLAEMNLYMYDWEGRELVRDNKIRWTLSALANIIVINQLDAAVLVQFRTRWNYAEDDWKDIYYRNRTIDTSDPTRLEFYRVILALTYKL